MRVAGAQIAVTHDVSANVASILRAVEFARGEGADVLLTPEGSLSGYRYNFDEPVVREALDFVVAKATGVGLALGTCFQEADGKRYNQVRFYDRDGSLVGWHAKILLCKRVATGEAGELDQFSTRPLSTSVIAGRRVGALVCNDMWANPEWTPQDDPHLSSRLAALGASVVFVAVNSGVAEGDELTLARSYHDVNLRLRARSGGQWFVVADAADPSGRLACNAPSGVVGPDGNWVVQVEGTGEQMFAWTIKPRGT